MFKDLAGLSLALLLIALVCLPVALSLYGLVLAFKASILVGILALLVEPAPLVVGVVAFFGHTNLAELVAKALGL